MQTRCYTFILFPEPEALSTSVLPLLIADDTIALSHLASEHTANNDNGAADCAFVSDVDNGFPTGTDHQRRGEFGTVICLHVLTFRLQTREAVNRLAILAEHSVGNLQANEQHVLYEPETPGQHHDLNGRSERSLLHGN
jgi:hypothetical protein